LKPQKKRKPGPGRPPQAFKRKGPALRTCRAIDHHAAQLRSYEQKLARKAAAQDCSYDWAATTYVCRVVGEAAALLEMRSAELSDAITYGAEQDRYHSEMLIDMGAALFGDEFKKRAERDKDL
jgi:hypothetical protein